MLDDSRVRFLVGRIVDYRVSLIVLLVEDFGLEPYGTVFQRTVAIVIILVDTAVSDAIKKHILQEMKKHEIKLELPKEVSNYIHINSKRKLVGPDYINNVEKNNE